MEPVRIPLSVRETSTRTLDQRLGLRFPGLSALGFRLLARLPPSSRVRQRTLRRAFQQAIEAYNRRDLEAVAIGFDRDFEYYPYREFVDAGLAEPCYHGPAGYRTYIEDTYDVWGEDVKLFATELIDLGDRIVVLADMPMRARASGIALSEKYAAVWTIGHGRMTRVQDYLDPAEALAEVGLPG